MKKMEAKRKKIVGDVADHILKAGLSQTSLRQIAKAINVSDRMLMYYFKDKDDILKTAFEEIAGRLLVILEASRPKQMPYSELVPFLAASIRDPQVRPFMRVWLEIVSPAAMKEEPYAAVCQTIFKGFLDWISSVLQVEDENERKPMASLALATIEGVVLLDALNYNREIEEAIKGLSLLNKK